MSRFKLSSRPGSEPVAPKPVIQPQRKEEPNQILHKKEDMELVINDENLNRELMDQPLTFKKYTTILSELTKATKLIKLQLEEKEAELQIKFSSDGTGKRVKEVEANIVMDEDIKRLKRELIEKEELVDQFTGIVKAFSQRHEMIKDLCANKRKELL